MGYPFFGQLILDCLNRTEHAMTQEHAFKAAELCVQAQRMRKFFPRRNVEYRRMRTMINVAIVGTGNICPKHIEAYLQFPQQCKIVALVDIYPEKAREKAQRYNFGLRCIR